MPAAHLLDSTVIPQQPVSLPAPEPHTQPAKYLFRRSSGIQKMGIRSWHPSWRCAREFFACTRIARRYRNAGTACRNAIQTGSGDTGRWDRIRASAQRRNSRSAHALRFPPCAGCADRVDPAAAAAPAAGDPFFSLHDRARARGIPSGYTSGP